MFWSPQILGIVNKITQSLTKLKVEMRHSTEGVNIQTMKQNKTKKYDSL